MNLIEELLIEIYRNKELLKQYEEIGPPGQFGKFMIQADIQKAKEALASNDPVEMLRIIETLKNNQ